MPTSESPRKIDALVRQLQISLLPGSMLIVTLFFMAISIKWRPLHDTPLMMYCGFLMEEFGKVPYRDFFEMNAPGTHLLHQGVVKLIGTSESGQRAWDLMWLFATQAAIVAYLRYWGMAVALCAACAISIQYLSWGPRMSLEREYLCLLPLALALLVAFRRPKWSLLLRAFGIGSLIGADITIKPPFLLYFPFLLVALVIWDERGESAADDPPTANPLNLDEPALVTWAERLHSRLRSIMPKTPPLELCWIVLSGLSGLMVVPLLCVAYLISHGAWNGFLEMAGEYWPLYADIGGDGFVRTNSIGRDAILLISNLSGHFMFLGLTAISAFVTLPSLLRKGGRQAVELWTLIGFCVLGVIYLGTSGKYWLYHALPLYFSFSLLVGFSLLQIGSAGRSNALRWLQCGILIVLFIQPLRMPDQADRIMAGEPYVLHRETTHVADLIRRLAQPGDQAQPFDVTTGAIHAMLLAEIDIATPFIYDFHFYHHPRSGITQRLRKRLLASMEEARPRFIISALHPWRPKGQMAAPNFPELESLIVKQYRVLWSGKHLMLMERRS